MKVGKIEIENPYQVASEIQRLLKDSWLDFSTTEEYYERLQKCKNNIWALKCLKRQLNDEINLIKTKYGNKSV